MSYPELSGRVVVVTGAAGGQGRAFVRGLSEQGVSVIAADISESGLAELKDVSSANPEHGPITPVVADISKYDDNERLVSVAMAQHGQLDFLVAAAGVYPRGKMIDYSAEEMRAVIQSNVEGQLYAAQTAARVMKPGSAIVTFSSFNALRATRERGAYSVTKAAVAHLTRALALELAELGIRVNSLAPGFIDTPMTHWIKEFPEAYQAALDKVPLGRVASPVEVMGPLLFLLSDSARYVTGHSLAVDGGSSI